MNLLIIVLTYVLIQDIPFKPKEEFEVKLDYQFKQRPVADHNTVNLSEASAQRTGGSGVLPYLVLRIKLISLPGEKTRVSITNNKNERPVNKRVSPNEIVELDLGFTDDMIDRVHAHQYTLTVVDVNKKPVERILINVAEDGSFFVNEEKRGKF
jgi:hypothetical protein